MSRLSPSTIVVALFSLPLVACGSCDDDGRGRLPDAAVIPDAPPDMMTTPQPVTITIKRNGTAMSGVKVFFQNADNTSVKTTTTDATGSASATMDAGGFVTAIDPFFVLDQVLGRADHELRTFA